MANFQIIGKKLNEIHTFDEQEMLFASKIFCS